MFRWLGFLMLQLTAFVMFCGWYFAVLPFLGEISFRHVDVVEDIIIAGVTSIVVAGLFWLPVSTLLINAYRRNAELSALKIRVEAADHAKARFLAACSHHLRTPVNIISGYASLLRNAPGTSLETRDEYVSGIIDGGRQLEIIINKILLFIALDDSHQSPYSEQRLTDVDRTAWRAIEAAKTKALARGIEISLESLPQDDEWTNEKVLRLFLDEAIDNALDHADASQITIRHECTPTACRLSVIDNGKGIPLEIRPALMNMFNVDGIEAYSGNASGLGMGLPLIGRATTCMGAELEIISETSIGTTLTMSMPRAPS